MKNAFVICALLAATVSAHMQMSNPYPIRSPLNPKGDASKKDYSYTSPLNPSGANFPCKGYQNDPFQSVMTYTAGSQYDISLTGSATHGGGSCQLSLSYDTGKTFTVIESIEGSCPLSSNYTFTIPSDAPTGQALLAWTWYNKVGNRELYMNCAQVTIQGGSSKRSHARDMMVARDNGSLPFKSRPPIFIANINGPGGCTTIANQEVQFPLPGPNLLGKVIDPGVGYKCTGTADFLGNGSSSASSSASSNSSSTASSPTSSAPPSSGNSTTNSSSSSSAGSSPAVNSTAATNTSPSGAPVAPAPVASSAPVPSAEPPSTSPSSGAQVPSTPASSSSSSAPQVVSSGAVNSGQACSTPGAIVCGSGGSTWSMCNQGALTFMGSVAAGTTCSNGAITRKK